METDEIKSNVGKRCKLVVRHLNGTNSVWTGMIIEETNLSYTIKTDHNEIRTEPKLYASVEWLSATKVV